MIRALLRMFRRPVEYTGPRVKVTISIYGQEQNYG